MNKLEFKYPLTRNQEALWTEWNFDKSNVAYNTCVQLRFEGKLDIKRFKKAFNNAFQYLDTLNAFFLQEDSQVWMCFAKGKAEVKLVDLTSLEPDQREKRRNEILEEKRQKKFDLTKFPLRTAVLIKETENICYFIVVVPHILSDGASALIFLEILAEYYNKGVAGFAEKYTKARKSWHDYLEYQKKFEERNKLDDAIDYWGKNLADAEHRLDIGVEPTTEDIAGQRKSFELSVEVTQKLKKIASANRTSFFPVLTAVYASFLYRYYGQQSFVIGYPVNLRPPGFKYAFGFFVNILPLKVRLDESVSFSDLVQQMTQQRRADKKYQFLSTLDIVKAKRRSMPDFDGRLCNVYIGQTLSRLQQVNLEQVDTQAIDQENIDVQDDLALMYEVIDQNVALWFEYKEACFSAKDIEHMIESFLMLADEVAENPDRLINDIDIVGTASQALILEDFQGPKSQVSPGTIHELIQKQAKENPHLIALSFAQESLTYKELNSRANQLANYLQKQGIRQTDNVAVLLARSFEQITTLLAILKLGAVYIPIDPSIPQVRLDSILERSEASALICDSTTKLATNKKILLDRVWEQATTLSDTDLNLDVRADDPAYIIYTSGSTGEPKGVLVNHAPVIARIDWHTKEFALKQTESVLQNISYAFDASVAEIWWPLSLGAKLVLVEPDMQSSPKHLTDLIEEHSITTVCMVPSAIKALLLADQNNSKTKLKSLRDILSGGEPLSKHLVKNVFQQTNARLHNVYGPTEACICASHKECTKDDTKVTIGKAIDNSTLYVLNKNLKLQNIGGIGELYIGGKALATGYYKDSELTEKRFLANPYNQGKIYKTGDLVKLLDNGDLAYLGRNDEQVKIRGHRIELNEINFALAQYPPIKEVATVVQERNGRNVIVAFYTSESRLNVNLKSFLAQKLPDYMIPTYFVELDAVPKLASEKVDQQKLKNFQNFELSNPSEIIPPETDDEKTLVRIWSTVLRIPESKIGVESNFFELGGDSLMILDITCAAEEQGILIEAHDLFRQRTIRKVLQEAKPISNIDREAQQPVEGEFPLLPRQEKFFLDGFKKPEHWNRCLYLEFDFKLDIKVLEESMNIILNHHDGLRLVFNNHENDWSLYNHRNDKKVDLVEYDLSHQNQKANENFIKEKINQAHASLKLNEFPLFRTICFKLSEDKYLFVLVIHHLLIDLRSGYILLEDLYSLYTQISNGIKPNLGAKSSSLKAWSEILQLHARESNLAKEIPFWQEQLQGTANKELPYDYDIDLGLITEKEQVTLDLLIDEDTTSRIIEEFKINQNIELHEFLLGTFAEAYREWTPNSKELVCNTCSHGRDQAFDGINLSRTVGWINTVFPVKIDLNANNLCQTVQEKFASVPSKGLNYGVLRFFNKNPLLIEFDEPTVFFNYIGKVYTKFDDNLPSRLIRYWPGIKYIADENKSCYSLYIEAAVVDNQILISLSFNKLLFREDNVRKLVKVFYDNIQQSIYKQELFSV